MKPSHPAFFLFGMGNRRKFLYRAGALYDALSGEMLRRWSPIHEHIIPHEYLVKWQTRDGKVYALREDETGVCLKVEGTHTYLTGFPLHLPDFRSPGHGEPQAHLLRVLLHEVLIHVHEGKPLTHFLAQAPNYRDAAIICEVLRRTGNLGLVKDWILGLDEPFDLMHGGEREPDNLGQALFLISMAADKGHPLVPEILEHASAFRHADFIDGRTDDAEHPVYQTKWLKFGLKSLGLPDPYKIPAAFDPYASVFWMDFRDVPNHGPAFPEKAKENSPHLAWAEAHFHNWDPPLPISSKAYPLSWEMQAGKAPLHGLGTLFPEFMENRLVTPQARHAAEMLLYYLDRASQDAGQSRSDQHELIAL